MTSVVDDEMNEIIFSAMWIVGGVPQALPYFMNVGDNALITYPLSFADLGLYTLEIRIEDGGGLFNVQQMVVNISNRAPYFLSDNLP